MEFSLAKVLLTCLILLSLSIGTSAQSPQTDVCIIGNDSGEFQSHVSGEIVFLNPPVCGFSSCACRPIQENQLLCGFCYDANLDDCLLNGQSKEYPDENLLCSCASNSIDFSCTELVPPNKSPTPSPNQQIPPEIPCVFKDSNGDEAVMDTSGVEGPCSGTKFPYVCNRDRNMLLYPYCQHQTNAGPTICANDGEYVVFLNEQGDVIRCDCSIDSDTFQPSSQCYPQSDSSTLAPTPAGSAQARSAAADIMALPSWKNARLLVVLGLFGSLWN